MVKELLADTYLMTKVSTCEAEGKLGAVVYQSFEKLEDGTGALLQAIQTTKESIKKSLSAFENFDPSKIVKTLDDINKRLCTIESRLNQLEGKESGKTCSVNSHKAEATEEFDLFGDDDEDAKPVERKAPVKVSKKPARVARSALIIDIKPLDDETNMEELEKLVREIKIDSLEWGKSELVPVCFGIKKLVIGCRIEDDKVEQDDIENAVMELKDHVQSMDVVSFNKAD